MAYGPFIHKINKGGIDEIIQHQQLISTTAKTIAGGFDAVRAHYGSIDGLIKERGKDTAAEGEEYIEFYTVIEPYKSAAPGLALWYMEEGKFLKIKVTAVFDEFGIRRL